MNWTHECLQCGYLLSGDASYRGRRVACPRCKAAVEIPAADDDGGYGLSALPPEEQARQEAALQPPEAGGGFPKIRGRKVRRVAGRRVDRPSASAEGELPVLGAGVPFDPTGISADPLVHLDCPNGHELEIEKSSMGQWAMCPHCGEQFEMLYRKTKEYRRDKELKEQREIARAGQKWLNYAIVAIVIAVMFLGLLIALAVGR